MDLWPDMQQGLCMTTITLEKAQAELAAIVKRVLAGEEILIEADDRRVRLRRCPRLLSSTKPPRVGADTAA
jgi:hypothetical protein